MNASMKSVVMPAYAKINPFLAVTGRREDGYHTLLSHMQAVTLQDTLTLRWMSGGDKGGAVRLHCDDPRLPCDGTNLVCRAAEAMLRRLADLGLDINGTLTVTLEKRIPMAAGLAGGSADAAATLLGVHKLFSSPLNMQEICDIGVGLGADVPFCLRCTEGAMTARGIGELLAKAPGIPSHAHLVIVCHGEGVSTPWAYGALDRLSQPDGERAEQAYRSFLKALSSGSLSSIGAASQNCFEQVVSPARPAVAQTMQTMLNCGAAFARMSGSGPSVVGFFDREDAAASCVQAFLEQGIDAYPCCPLYSII